MAQQEQITAQAIWTEYQKGVTYNTNLDLYETVKKNENFYSGKQWEGLNAPDLPKPVINVLKRVVSYFISMIVSDDVAANFEPFLEDAELDEQAALLSDQVAQVMEQCKLRDLAREVIRDAAVDGDGFLYFYFDPDAESGQEARGRIRAELLDNACVMFANPYSAELQEQDSIIIAMRKTLANVQAEARRDGLSEDVIESIRADDDNNLYNPSSARGDDLVTVVLRLYKQDGTIWAVKATQDVLLRAPWDLGYALYPLSVMRWERIKNSYHGTSALSAVIPNQIAINQLFAMAIHHVKTAAVPKVIYDASKIPSWSNKVGQAIGTIGNPNDAVATGFRAPDMSAQVMQLIELMIQKTLEFMGASDATLGNIKPDNTSAIIAVQQSSAMPLSLQKMEFYRFTEEYVRIIVDMIRVNYGSRLVSVPGDGEDQIITYDFGQLSPANLNMQVDVGASSYWSQLMQVQTLDNLFTKGIITDALTYLDALPDGYISGKGKLISALRERMAQQEAAQGMQPGGEEQIMPMPEEMPVQSQIIG